MSRPAHRWTVGGWALVLCLAGAGAAPAQHPAAGSLTELATQRPAAGAPDDLRQWLANEYAYVRSYRLLERAYARLRSGELDAATADFEALFTLHPQHPQLALYLAELQHRRGDTPRATQLLEDHLDRHPGSGYAAATLGYLYLEQGRREAAAAALEKALVAYGNDPAAAAVRANLAELAYAAGDYRRALTLYQALRPTLPADPLLAYRTGLAQRHLGLAVEAAASFQAALTGPGLPGDVGVRVRLEWAQALAESGDPAAAGRVLEALLAETQPRDPALLSQAKNRLFVLSLETGDCARALALYPELPAAEVPLGSRVGAGYCARRLNQPERAGALFRQVLDEGDVPVAEAARLRLDLAGLYAQQGKRSLAAQTLEELLAIPGVQPGLVRRGTLALAELRVALGQKAAARSWLDRLAAGASDEYTALRVVQLYTDLGLDEAARAHLQRLAESPENAPTLRLRAEQELAFLLLRRGDDAGAAAALQRAAEHPALPGAMRPRVVRALAEVKARTGPPAEARRWAREAWQASPDPALGLLLAGLEARLGDPAAAEAALDTVRRDATAPDALRRQATAELGTLYLQEGRTVEAEEAFWRVLDADPNNAYALASLLELAKRRGDGEDFGILARQLRRVDPKAVTVDEVAATTAELGDHRRALELDQELLDEATEPQVRARVLRRMGFSALQLGDRSAAAEYFQHYLNVATEPDLQVLEQLALVYIGGGDCAAALPPLETLGRLRQEADDALRLARCQEQLWNQDAAAAGYRRALELHYDPAAALALAWAEQRAGRPAAAVATLEELAKRSATEVSNPLRFEALVSLVTLYGEPGQKALREHAARRAAAVLPADAPLERALYALVLGGHDDPRLAAYETQVRALADAGERQAACLRLAALYEAVEEPERALEWAAAAVSAKPTPLARYRRGVLLYQAGDPAAAQGDFAAGLATHPEAALYLAYVHLALGRPGLAVDLLEETQGRPGNPPDLKARMGRQLAHLYLAEGRPEQALQASQAAGPEDAELWQVRARCLLQLGQTAAAVDAAARARALLAPEEPAHLQLLFGDIYRQQERWQEADREYTAYLQQHPNAAAVLHAAAECRTRSGDPDGARDYLRRAVAAEPDHPRYRLDYGYALAAAGERDAALQVLDAYLESFPDAPTVLEDVGYLNLHAGRNAAAAARLRAAIDQLAPPGEVPAAADAHRDGLRRTVWDLEKRFSLAGYLVRSDLGGSGSLVGYRGITAGQLGLEGGWRPPGFGFYRQRSFEVTARMLGSFDEDAWSYDAASTQLALGAKVKPFASANLVASLERLVKIGSHSENNWLARAMFSHAWGRQPRFAPGWGPAGSIYAEVDRTFADLKRTVVYGEVRGGPRWALSPHWAVLPHAVADGRWEDTQNPAGTYLEGGLGLELLGGWGATAYHTDPWSLSAYLQYKAGTFEHAPPGHNGKSYQGPVLGVIVRR